VVYQVEVVSLADAVRVQETINLIAVNETRFVVIVVQQFENEGAAVPSGFSVTAAAAVVDTQQILEGMFLFNGVWSKCGTGKAPNSRKDDCEYCPDGSYSTDGVCQTCDAGSTSSSLRDICIKNAKTPLYKEDWVWGVVGALLGVAGLISWAGCSKKTKGSPSPSTDGNTEVATTEVVMRRQKKLVL
jgi:hypothetical protein